MVVGSLREDPALRRGLPRFAPALALLLGLSVADGSAAGGLPGQVFAESFQISPLPDIRPLSAAPGFSGAIAPDSLAMVCLPDKESLIAYFVAKGLSYSPVLIRFEGDRACHVLYRPSAPGFRAVPEALSPRTLYCDVELLSFLSGRTQLVGDSLDILKSVLSSLDTPVKVSLGLDRSLPGEFYAEAQNAHFSYPTRHSIVFRESSSDRGDSWPRDYLVSGNQAGESRLLVTRRLFEGNPAKAALFSPVLESLREVPFVRSRLSWEAGDLLFTVDPGKAGEVFLLFGNTAWNYWGAALSVEEYGWVLRQEFGVDRAFDLTFVPGHLDNYMAFLPTEGIALVSRPHRGNRAVACAAIQALTASFGEEVPDEVTELNSLLCNTDVPLAELASRVSASVDQIGRMAQQWSFDDPELRVRLDETFQGRCGRPPVPDCIAGLYSSGTGRTELLREHRNLLQDWVETSLITSSGSAFVRACLSLVKGQVEPGGKLEAVSQRLASRLEQVGFRVGFVPMLPPGTTGAEEWTGINYVNSVLIENRLFVPTFGLGVAEEALLQDIQRFLPSRYRVVPVYARSVLLRNGGVHCSIFPASD